MTITEPQPTIGQLVFDPTAPGYFDDPSSQLDALREASPLVPRPDVDGWMVTRYGDVQRLARDRRLGNSPGPAEPGDRCRAGGTRGEACGCQTPTGTAGVLARV